MILYIKPGIEVGKIQKGTELYYSSGMKELQGHYIIAEYAKYQEDVYTWLSPACQVNIEFYWMKEWVEKVDSKHFDKIGIGNMIRWLLGDRDLCLIHNIKLDKMIWHGGAYADQSVLGVGEYVVAIQDLVHLFNKKMNKDLVYELFARVRKRVSA